MFEGENDFGFVPGGGEDMMIMGDGGEKQRQKSLPAPSVSSLSLRSLRMTSGLFNTGLAGGSKEFPSCPPTVYPSTSTATKFVAHDDFLASTLDQEDDDLDMDVFGDLGNGLDPLGDESLDSFTDLTALLSEHNAFFDQLKVEAVESFSGIGTDADAAATTQPSLKRSFDEMEAESADLDLLTARVGMPTAPNLDHDYSSKRPRMSAATEEPASAQEISLPSTAAPSPTPSTSFTFAEPAENKSRNRREKNNIASKRSREIRKKKVAGMESEADQLIGDNARMEKRIAELEKLAKKMKEILVAKMAGK
ncbi:hypothetical protein ACOMHN_049859 [Nucella lapillus]